MNGRLDWRTVFTLMIFLVQLALGSFGYSVRQDTRNTNENIVILRSEIQKNSDRIRRLEDFAARGDVWTLSQQRDHELTTTKELKEIWRDIAEVKASIVKMDKEVR